MNLCYMMLKVYIVVEETLTQVNLDVVLQQDLNNNFISFELSQKTTNLTI